MEVLSGRRVVLPRETFIHAQTLAVPHAMITPQGTQSQNKIVNDS